MLYFSPLIQIVKTMYKLMITRRLENTVHDINGLRTH